MQKKRFSKLFIFLTLLGFGYANTVYHYHLSNGLNLFVKVDKRAPVVVSQVWYKVGSSYEPNGTTGISHVVEHMMFQGTKKHPENQFSKIIAENGGQENAATSYDYTYYYQELASDKLNVSFKLEADRMKNLALTQKDFKKEIQVVQEERRMRLDNNPQAVTFERFMAAAFLANPYHHPVVGWMSDLQHMTDADVRSWYQSWYAPNNAVVVVVGDVVPEQVFKLAKQYFGPVPAHQLPVLKPHPTVPQLGKRVVRVNMPAKLPLIIMGYHVPSIKTSEKKWVPYALELAADTLDGGESARLPTRLIRGSEVASAVNVSYDPFTRLSTLFTLTGIPGKNHSVKDLKKSLMEQVNLLKTTLVSQAELQRIKTQLKAQKTYAMDSLSYQAQMIGSLQSVGISWKVGENFLKSIDAITPRQIQSVAKQFFTKKNLTIAYLHPEKFN